jgi:thiol-disulfide isomerase/thioredoxin
MKYIAPFLMMIILFGCYGKKPEHTGKEGKLIPSFKILLPDSVTWVSTNNIKPGNPTVVFLFGPHCPYSKAQMKKIIDNAGKLKDIQFYVVTPYPFKQMQEFYKTYSLNNYPNITVGFDPSNFFGNYMKVNAVPYMAIYNKDKILTKAFIGKTEIATIQKAALN